MSEQDEPEVVPFDQVDQVPSGGHRGSPPSPESRGGSRRSLIGTVMTASSDKLVDLIENNAAIKVNAFNSADQEEADQFVQRFWYWRNYSSYLLSFLIMTLLLTALTYAFEDTKYFAGILGALSSFIEALLGLPQLLLNFQKKSTHGLAFLLIAMWTWGDFYKLLYYISIEGPIQLICCSVF